MKWSMKKTGILLILAALSFVLMGFQEVHNSRYEFYKEHYETCKKARREAKSAYNESTFAIIKQGYAQIVDSYDDMMEDDKEEIDKYETRSLIYYILAGVLGVLGIVFIVIKPKAVVVNPQPNAEISTVKPDDSTM